MEGFAGNILQVNLTTGEIKKEPLKREVVLQFIGGMGVNVKLAYDLIEPGTDPLSPQNKIIVGVGPLVGTNIPGSSRVACVTKLPVNGAIGWGNGGGMNFGCMLKHAGYDHIVVQGRASQPVFLKIFDDDVEICDANDLWGTGSGETVNKLREKYGRSIGVVSTGQAGEQCVRTALTLIDKAATMGRGGLGAVFGSKNLKAIVAKGTKGITVADRKGYRSLMENLWDRMRKYPALKDVQKYGFLTFVPAIPKEEYLNMKKARLACISCPMGDKEVLEIKRGPFKGFTMATTAVNIRQPRSYGYIDNWDECIKLTNILDEYGLDRFEAYELLRFADQLYREGMITEAELGSPGIDFSFDSLVEWFHKIAYREGFGNTLAEGFGVMLERIGEEVEAFAPAVARGMTAYQGVTGPVFSDLFTTFEFGMAVHPRGPASAPGGSSPLYFTRGRPAEWIAGHLDRMGVPQEAIQRIFTSKDGMAVNVGRMEKYAQQFLLACDCLGMCGRGQINRFNSAKLQAELYTAVTGLETTPESLQKSAERVFTLLKAANVREKFERNEDRFPKRWFGDKKHMDYYEKVDINESRAYGMLDDFYDERGWDIERGIPTLKKLQELELDYVIEDAKKVEIEYP